MSGLPNAHSLYRMCQNIARTVPPLSTCSPVKPGRLSDSGHGAGAGIFPTHAFGQSDKFDDSDNLTLTLRNSCPYDIRRSPP